MLSKNVETAQASANELRRLLTSTHPDSQSVYCKSISDCPVMMEELNAFCDRQVPCLLWRGKAAYATLYIFLATRFLSAPDSVLDCEGTHALWKWVELRIQAWNLVQTAERRAETTRLPPELWRFSIV